MNLVAEEHGEDLLGAAGAYEYVHAREALAEPAQDPGEDVSGDRKCGAETQGAKLDVADLLDGVASLLESLKNALDIRAKGVAGVGKADAPSAAFEKLLTQLAFEGLDTGSDRGLG
jgi:hypothetical protein